MSRALATSDVFTAIAEPRRRQIIALLAHGRGLAVGAIVLSLGLPQPAVSKHLGVLRGVGVVSVARHGQRRLYQLNFEKLRPVYDWIKPLEQHWERQLDRISERAQRRAQAIAFDSARSKPKKGTS